MRATYNHVTNIAGWLYVWLWGFTLAQDVLRGLGL